MQENPPTKRAPYPHEFQGFLNELSQTEPFASDKSWTEVGDWVIGSFDVLERTLQSIANKHDAYANKMRPLLRAIIRGGLSIKEKHELVHSLLMSMPTRPR
jgi:hypothetical protein